MKKIFLAIFISFSMFSCTQERHSYYNPYIPDMGVNLLINLNLADYAVLNYVNNSIVENSQGYFGVIVYHSPVGFVAYEATCSNHPIVANSRLTVQGEVAKCNHCTREYFLLNGEPVSKTEQSEYFLKPYAVIQNGNVLTIRNF